MRGSRRVASLLAFVAMVAAPLAGCTETGPAGATLHNASAWEGHCYDLGGSGTISFSDDGSAWHYVPCDEGSESSGTWHEEGDAIVLEAASFTSTLVRSPDGSYYSLLDEEGTYGTRYYVDEGDAARYRDDVVASADDAVREILESTEFSRCYESWPYRVEQETISFSDGSASYARGTYDSDTFLGHMGPPDSSWEARDHSGACSIEVERLARGGDAGEEPRFEGTLTIGGDPVDFVLERLEDGAVLHLGQLTFIG